MPASNIPSVLVIGGGVIGCSIAYSLARRGVSVTVVDKGEIGHGCSYGNAGWLVPSHAVPLPAPGALGSALRWMLNKDSPLYIKPRPSPAMAAWLLRFLACANQRHYRYGAQPLVHLAVRSLELVESFIEEHGGDELDFRKAGLLYVCRTDRALADSRHELEVIRELGLSGNELSDAELREHEPLLKGRLVGGILLEGEAQIEPLRIVQALAREAGRMGATFLPDTEVESIETAAGRVVRVVTATGDVAADEVVLAAGSWTPLLAKPLRIRAPIQAGKGYALIVEGMERAPSRPLLLVDRKVAVTPRVGSVRFAGTMELAGLDESITSHRLDAVRRAANDYLDLPSTLQTVETWAGLRPCTPDGLPMIGRAGRWKNVTVAAGHAMLGLTLCTGTGELVAQLLTGEEPQSDPAPFRPDRF